MGSTPLDILEFNPLGRGAEGATNGDAAQTQTASEVDALAAQAQLITNALEAVLSSAEISDETPPESAQQAFIEAYNTKEVLILPAVVIKTIFNSADPLQMQA